VCSHVHLRAALNDTSFGNYQAQKRACDPRLRSALARDARPLLNSILDGRINPRLNCAISRRCLARGREVWDSWVAESVRDLTVVAPLKDDFSSRKATAC
jgi:hypothetical protein